MLKRDYKRREPTNEERIFLKSRGLIPDSWLILYENKSELVVVSRRRSYRKVLKKPRKKLMKRKKNYVNSIRILTKKENEK